jgi:putative membrane protein
MRNETVLREARFDSKLPSYWMISTLIGLTATVIGIPFIPLVLIFGWAFFQKRFEALQCRLTERSLHIKRGVIFRSEKNIPLDKIQDIGMTEGPLLRRLGLASLAVETAGQSSPQGAADAALVGVVDAPAFRDAILEQRDRVAGSGSAREFEAASSPGLDASSAQLLLRISESLERIEGLLERSQRS